jgi:hypothetical protein
MAMLRASLNIPGPMPSEPNFSNTRSSALGLVREDGLEAFAFELDVFLFEDDQNTGISPTNKATTPASKPNAGINSKIQSHRSGFRCSVAPRRSTLMTWAGRPSAAFG